MDTMPQLPPHDAEKWEGYTLDELRYMRAYTAARLEIARERLTHNASGITDVVKAPMGGGQNIFTRILGALSYIDVAVLTFKIGKSAYRIFRSLRGK